MNELNESFQNLVEKYKKAEEIFEGKKADCFSAKKYTTGWTGLVNGVFMGCCIVGTIAVCLSASLVGVPAFLAAAVMVVYGVSAGYDAYRKLCIASEKCKEMTEFYEEQMENCVRVEKLASDTAKKLRSTAKHIQVNVHFFVARLRKCLQEKASAEKYSELKNGLGPEKGEGEVSVEDLFEALECMIEETEARNEDFVAGIKATIQACTEVQ